MVLGEYEQKFNGKNRITLAKKIRKEFGKILILSKGYDNCIFGFNQDYWNKVSAKEFEKSIMTEEGVRARRKMFSGAEEVVIDSHGRVVIPENLLRYAEIDNEKEDELIVVGAGDHLEIWKKSNWKNYQGSNL